MGDERMARIEERYRALSKNMEVMIKRFVSHMQKEEKSFDKIEQEIEKMKDRFGIMEHELHESFKERDNRINELEKSLVKILAYASAAFFVLSLFANYVIKHL